MDVEHTKARISSLRTQLDVCKVHRIIPGDSTVEAAVSIAESLVAAVERAQAIAEELLATGSLLVTNGQVGVRILAAIEGGSDE